MEQPDTGVSPEALQLLIAGIFDILAVRAGEHWRLDPIEAETLSAQAKPVMDAFFPGIGQSKWLLLIFFSAQLGVILLPRIRESQKLAERKAGQADTRDAMRAGRIGQDNPAEAQAIAIP